MWCLPNVALSKASMSKLMFLERMDSWVKVLMPASLAFLKTCSRAPGSLGTTRMASTPLAIMSSTRATCWAASASAGLTIETFSPPSSFAAFCIPMKVLSNMGCSSLPISTTSNVLPAAAPSAFPPAKRSQR